MAKPSLRIAITPLCNLKCKYSPIHGDSYILKGKPLDLASFTKIIEIASDTGIAAFSITGGEPLAVPDLTFGLVDLINKFHHLKYLKLNTNGILISRYIEQIRLASFNEIKVSLDSLNAGIVEKVSSRPDSVTPVLKGIDLLINSNIPVRLQTVVGKYNLKELTEIINFCIEKNINIKIFDITYYEKSNAGNSLFWQENYVPVTEISAELEKLYGPYKVIHAGGGYDHPMRTFEISPKVKIQVRDSNISTFYSPKCEQCPHYMCQDGLCNITLSADGRLKICRNEGYDFDLVGDNGELKSDKEIENYFEKILEIFAFSKSTLRPIEKINLPLHV